MMLIEIKVPQLAEGTPEGTVAAWHVAPGQAVQRDQNLCDIETDKVVLETPAQADGVLVEIKVPAGSTVTSGTVLGVLDTEAQPSEATARAAKAPAAAVSSVERAASLPPSPPAAVPAPSREALPAAKKLMAEQGLDPANVAGTGRGERITKGDVLRALETQRAAAGAAEARAPAPRPAPAGLTEVPAVEIPLANRPEQRVPMSRLRQRVAERLVQSQATAAILTTFNEVNMKPVIDLRNTYKEKFEKEHGVKLGFMSFFVKAAVHALKKFPIINASVDGTDIVYHGYFDIGIAVGSPRGLVVPILRDADQMSFAEIEKQIADFGKRAAEGKLSIEELTGGTFTISNGGVFGSMLSTPIINPPQSAILGVHATKDRPVVENGQIVIRPINYLALSYDHRIIDGREAVLFLVAIKEALEDPARLLLDL
ncbi:MAG: 2-oxoglutarate dehydrogenase complex dihydrolipoyllysine-residue succinyltransferase [Casimicrobiaceae bacterium]|nr:2-oxoglutarate dehydrogenase complex dihydrolipoyllysine-residue succinyltransferase [Casimicrobiaceae bacterium]MDW8312801.1 2-oxoglutarate dehydrogenase complex dihydrolipoyllysine-residue succinyltransferase [Burkholderiales bacterium]